VSTDTHSGRHNVVLYMKEHTREFSITARTNSARLREVNEQMNGLGYTLFVLATGLSKSRANEMRDDERDTRESQGFTYRPREALS
jgi:hypothetical protein